MVVNVVDATQQKIDYKQKSVFKNVFVRVCVFFWCPCVPRLTYLLLNVIDQARKKSAGSGRRKWIVRTQWIKKKQKDKQKRKELWLESSRPLPPPPGRDKEKLHDTKTTENTGPRRRHDQRCQKPGQRIPWRRMSHWYQR